jgi:myosin-crossreactive antigen
VEEGAVSELAGAGRRKGSFIASPNAIAMARYEPADRSKDHLWIVGGGIAGMAAAAFAIRDARVPANQVHILEMLGIEGGSLDGGRTANNKGAWVTRGARMLTEELNQCTWDLIDGTRGTIIVSY